MNLMKNIILDLFSIYITIKIGSKIKKEGMKKKVINEGLEENY